MQASNAPTKSPVPFAESGSKNTIPVASQIGVTPGLASFTDGFPPLTMTPLSAGGIPPRGLDFNGILYFLSAAVRWQQAGGAYTYDSAFATSIGGYPKGAVLLKADLSGFWVNGTENNTTNPDAGGAGWSDPMAGRLLNVRVFNTPGTTTYTPTPGTNRRVIEVLGAGGQGGGVENDTVASTMATAAGGGAGAYGVLHIAGAATSATVTVGAGGTGATTGTGVSGGSSSFGSLLTCAGGLGGQFGRSATIPTAGPTLPGGDGGANPAGATVGFPGAAGMTGAYLNAGVTSGMGASSRYGAGGNSRSTSTPIAQAGNPGQGFGSGGSGAARVGVGSNQVGGAGAPGIVIVWEYS